MHLRKIKSVRRIQMLNKVLFIGRIVKDPEVKVTTSGVAVATFSIAVGRNYANTNGEKETDFFNVVAYRKLAEIIGKYVKKGSLISIDGKIQNRSYEAQDGSKRYITEIICENVVFLDTKETSNQSTQQKAEEKFNKPTKDISEDDLPF